MGQKSRNLMPRPTRNASLLRKCLALRHPVAVEFRVFFRLVCSPPCSPPCHSTHFSSNVNSLMMQFHTTNYFHTTDYPSTILELRVFFDLVSSTAMSCPAKFPKARGDSTMNLDGPRAGLLFVNEQELSSLKHLSLLSFSDAICCSSFSFFLADIQDNQ